MSYETLLGVYHYCLAYHGGQWSREYRVLCRVSKKMTPSRSEEYASILDKPGYERSREVYDALVSDMLRSDGAQYRSAP